MVAHHLDPPMDSPALLPTEIERRLRAEFAYVEADVAAGSDMVASMIRQLERMNAPPATIKEHRQLLPFAVRFVVADAADFTEAYLCFTALPGKGFLIGYHGATQEQEAGPLLERCARSLGYEVTLL